MGGLRFAGRDAWIAAVTLALTCRDAVEIVAAHAIDPETLLAIARVEAAWASDAGVCVLSHARLAELTGVVRPAVLRARLALIELGLEDLVAAPGASGNVYRELRHS